MLLLSLGSLLGYENPLNVKSAPDCPAPKCPALIGPVRLVGQLGAGHTPEMRGCPAVTRVRAYSRGGECRTLWRDCVRLRAYLLLNLLGKCIQTPRVRPALSDHIPWALAVALASYWRYVRSLRYNRPENPKVFMGLWSLKRFQLASHPRLKSVPFSTLEEVLSLGLKYL